MSNPGPGHYSPPGPQHIPFQQVQGPQQYPPSLPSQSVSGVSTGGMPPTQRAKNSTGRRVVSIVLCVFGGLAMLGGGGITAQMIVNANQDVRNRTEYGPVMWRNAPAEKLFPKSLGKKRKVTSSATDPRQAEWRRVGIAQKTACALGVSGPLAAAEKKRGCKAVLRGTYVDPTGNTVATIALVVLPKGPELNEQLGDFFESGRHGVKTFAVPGTSAARWKDGGRNGSGGHMAEGEYLPYDVAVTTGAVDGRKSGRLPEEWDYGNKSDSSPWREAAQGLADDYYWYIDDLLTKETS